MTHLVSREVCDVTSITKKKPHPPTVPLFSFFCKKGKTPTCLTPNNLFSPLPLWPHAPPAITRTYSGIGCWAHFFFLCTTCYPRSHPQSDVGNSFAVVWPPFSPGLQPWTQLVLMFLQNHFSQGATGGDQPLLTTPFAMAIKTSPPTSPLTF